MKVFRAEPLPQYQFHDKNLGLLDRLLIKSRRERPDFNRRMFDEDFAEIFLSSNRRTSNLFEVNSSDDELTRRLLGNVKTRYGTRSVDETIREMIEDIAQSLLWFGEAYYFLHDDPEKEETHIGSFSAERIFALGRMYFQFLPKRLGRGWNSNGEKFGRELRLLDGKKLMRFRLPRSIKRKLSAQNSILASLDKHQYSSTEFLTQATHENPNPRNNFDFRVWRDTHDFALYRATRKTGWNGRKYDSTKRSDFFDCHRMIRFRRNQLMLRDKILAQLSKEFTRVGKHYATGFQIVVSSTNTLPSVTDLNELETRLSREEAGFTEVMEYFFKR